MLHCNGIDPFVTLMGNFNWGTDSRNDIVSRSMGSRYNSMLVSHFRLKVLEQILFFF